MNIIIDPKEIEKRSFEIIGFLLDKYSFPDFKKSVVTRIVHATADLSYAEDLSFSKGALETGVKALRSGANIITDVTMLKAGINRKILGSFGGEVICLLNDKDIIRKSRELNVTRAVLALRKASKFINGSIIAIGNAPTALFELCDLVRERRVSPALIVGVPVGFVGAVESKEELRSLKVPYITNKSRKGGSSVAASCINALLKIAERKEVER